MRTVIYFVRPKRHISIVLAVGCISGEGSEAVESGGWGGRRHTPSEHAIGMWTLIRAFGMSFPRFTESWEGHAESPDECPHPDCVLTRGVAASSPPAGLDRLRALARDA